MDIMDAEGPDVEWPVENGKVLKVNHLGKNIENYDSMLVLIHFKGHPHGRLRRGAEAALHRLRLQRGQGLHPPRRQAVTDQNVLGELRPAGYLPWEVMADAASTVAKHFAGKIAYVAVMKNLSVDCDCCAVAEDPCMDDVGILSSLIPLRWTVPAWTLVETATTPAASICRRVNSRHGTHTHDRWRSPRHGTQGT